MKTPSLLPFYKEYRSHRIQQKLVSDAKRKGKKKKKVSKKKEEKKQMDVDAEEDGDAGAHSEVSSVSQTSGEDDGDSDDGEYNPDDDAAESNDNGEDQVDKGDDSVGQSLLISENEASEHLDNVRRADAEMTGNVSANDGASPFPDYLIKSMNVFLFADLLVILSLCILG